MTKELKLEVGKIYLSKEVFNNPELTIVEVRLLALLSSVGGLTLDEMDSNTKLWLCSGSKNNYSKLRTMNENLKSLGLINKDGTGKTLGSEGNYISFNNTNEIDSCKNIRQLFVKCCLDKWDTRHSNAIISKEMFHGLFGETTKRITENWNRAIEQTGLKIGWHTAKGSVSFRSKDTVDDRTKKVMEKFEVEVTFEPVKEVVGQKSTLSKGNLLGSFKNAYRDDYIQEPSFTPDFEADVNDLDEMVKRLVGETNAKDVSNLNFQNR